MAYLIDIAIDLQRQQRAEIRHDEFTGLAIVKMSDEDTKGIADYVRGLVFDEASGEIVCPGIHSTRHYDAEKGIDEAQINWVTPLIDGVNFRVYWSNKENRFVWSTNGMVTPNRGWYKGGKTFNQLFLEVLPEGLLESLDKELCYRFTLLHRENPILTMPEKNELVFTGATTMSQPYKEVPPVHEIGVRKIEVGHPVDYEAHLLREGEYLGLVYYMKDGSVIRRESTRCAYMKQLRINTPDPLVQWMHLLDAYCINLETRDYNEVLKSAEVDVLEYLRYFPWHTPAFNAIRGHFLEMAGMITDKITAGFFVPYHLVPHAEQIKASLEENFLDNKDSAVVLSETVKQLIANKKALEEVMRG
jgi:hypothetical protein